MHHIIYISTAHHLMHENELADILEKSQQLNMERDITGMLIYMEGIFVNAKSRTLNSVITGKFIQVVEGPEKILNHLFDQIKLDNRHFDIIELTNLPIAARSFDSWQMGFKTMNLLNSDKDSRYLDLNNLFSGPTPIDTAYSLGFLKSFYQRGISHSTQYDSYR